MSDIQPRDEELVLRVGGGDSRALEMLYERYASALLGLAMKVLGDRASAEEVVQDTFWRVWRYASAFRAQRGSFANWLFGIARNLAIDELRRRRIRPQLVQAEGSPLGGVEGPTDLAEEAWLRERRERILRALERLPEAQRRVLELAYFQGLTRQEIAESTGEPLGTVHTRARLGLNKLRELLRSQHVQETG
ncbi:MAG: sigma-70 family RNA polymerase sigma factor [Chloroflexi bacterium]|nr:sigma-70 family RNA polymerase sigma factor [Chloroflexota bacterium]